VVIRGDQPLKHLRGGLKQRLRFGLLDLPDIFPAMSRCLIQHPLDVGGVMPRITFGKVFIRLGHDCIS